MGQGALYKPVVQWWLSLNSSTATTRVLRASIEFPGLARRGAPQAPLAACQIYQIYGFAEGHTAKWETQSRPLSSRSRCCTSQALAA